MKKGLAVLVVLAGAIPAVAYAECTFIDRGDSVEAVCGAQEPKADRDVSEIIERYKNGISKETYERCKESMPADKTPEEYSRMTNAERIAAMNERMRDLNRYDATGCTIRGGSTALTSPEQIAKYKKSISCLEVGSKTICSDKTTFEVKGDTVTDSHGLICTIVDSCLECNPM